MISFIVIVTTNDFVGYSSYIFRWNAYSVGSELNYVLKLINNNQLKQQMMNIAKRRFDVMYIFMLALPWTLSGS